MADLINKDTLQIARSVNTPDYATPPWYPVDLSQVSGIAQKYWKWDGANLRPVTMTQAEKDAVDAALLKASDMAAKWLQIIKTANETRTATTTLANDTGLKGTAQPLAKYIFRAHVFFDTTAAGDFKFAIVGPASPVGVRIERCAIAAGAAAFSAVAVDTAFGVSVSVTGTGTNGGYVEINGEFETGAAGGTVAFQWAQNTSDAGNTRVLEGSYIEFQRIG